MNQRMRVVQQHSLIILADIKPNQIEGLHETLEQIGRCVTPDDEYFHDTTTVHYAAWMVLPNVKDTQGHITATARLVLETNYDGDLETHLHDLISHCGCVFDQLYKHCAEYPPDGCDKREEVVSFLKERSLDTNRRPAAYFVALPGRTVADIRNAIEVYEESKRFVDHNSYGRNADTVWVELINHFKGVPTNKRPQRFPITQKALRRLFVFNLISGIPRLLGLVFSWVPLILIARWFEKRELRHYRQKGLVEDQTDHNEEYAHLYVGRQNHLCTFTTVKPGRFRMLVLCRALALARLLSSTLFILGKLDQINTVHFLRWILIDQQLLLVSNYDGDYSAYLSDFSDQAMGVNLIWSNTFGFPPTQFLLRGGASDLEGFETHALRHYSPAPVFYSAYRNYSLRNIVRFLSLRDELAEAITT